MSSDVNMQTTASYESDAPVSECARCGEELEWPAVAPNPEDAEFMHMPRLLACLHTLCNSCVEDVRARGQRRAADPAAAGRVTLECPTCSEPTALELPKVTLPTDWATVRALRRQEQASAEQTCAECADTSEHEPQAAVAWCRTCCYGLCEEHHANHRHSRRTAEHQVMLLGEFVASPAARVVAPLRVCCVCHAAEELHSFCTACGEAVCRDCVYRRSALRLR